VDKTVLANEQIDDQGRSWRSGALAQKKMLSQWFVRTTRLAEDLHDDLEKLDQWPNVVKEMQKGWIGLKPGFIVTFKVLNSRSKAFLGNIEIFTTRIETIYGVTFMGIREDYECLKLEKEELDRIKDYKEKNQMGTYEKEKNGLLLEGVKAIHPLTGKEIPIYICNYILKEVGTGAIMGVPAHDDRDKDFAEKLRITPIIQVLDEKNGFLIAFCLN